MLEQLRPGGGVRLARLPHAPAHQALEILVGGHRGGSLGRPRAASPSGDARGVPKIGDGSGSVPPFASRGPWLGQGRRGWARIGRPSPYLSIVERTPAGGKVGRPG